MKIPRVSFNAGEISPTLYWRSDLAKYPNSCKLLENYINLPQGGVRRRAGMEVVARIADVNTEVRIIPWEVSRSEYFQLIFIGTEIQIYNADGAKVFTLAGVPWIDTDFQQLYFKQVFDIMYIAHPSYPLQQIRRTSTSVWEIAPHEFLGGPFGDENSDTSITVDMAVTAGTALAPGLDVLEYEHSAFNGLPNFGVLTPEFEKVHPTFDLGYTSSTSKFATEFIGKINITTAGSYDFRQGSDDFSRLLVDSVEIIAEHNTSAATGSAIMVSGDTDIKVEFNEFSGSEFLTMEYRGADTGNVYVPIPADRLFREYSSDITLTASQDLFTVDDIGRLFRLRSNENTSDSGNFGTGDVGSTSSEFDGLGIVVLRTEGGIWEGILALEESADGGTTWLEIGSITSKDGKHNGEIEREIVNFGSKIRVIMKTRSAAPSDTGCIWTLEVQDTQYHYIEIQGFNSATEVTGVLQAGTANGVADYETSSWVFGAFGETPGYPTCVEIYEERLMLAGAFAKPSTIFGSTINEWNNYRDGTFATSPIQFTLSADVRNRIRWMVPEQELIIGSDYGEWTIGTRDTSTALSGENVSAKRQTQFGTDQVQPVVSSDLTLYVEAGGKRMRSVQYSYEKDGYVAADMTILSQHLTEGTTLTRMAFSRSPDQIVWAIRADGELLAFTYEREHGVSAWSRHPLSDGSTVKDINSILTNDGDVVSVLVNRSDGLYFEVMRQDSLCFDWQRHYTNVLPTDVITLVGNEAFEFYNEQLNNEATHFEAKESGIYINILNPVTSLVIIYDGTQLDIDIDFISMGSDLYWYPIGTDKGLIVVQDGVTVLTDGVDYALDEQSEILVIDLLSGLYDPNDLVILEDGVPLVETVDYWIMSGAEQMLIISNPTGQITVEADSVPLTAADFVIVTPTAQVASLIDTSFYTAIPMISLIQTTDLLGNIDAGGGGNRGKIHEVDCFVVNSVGGEISGDNGKTWAELKQTLKTVVAGQRIPEVTGKIESRIQHGYNNKDDLTLSFRNQTPYNQIVAAFGIKLQGISK